MSKSISEIAAGIGATADEAAENLACGLTAVQQGGTLAVTLEELEALTLPGDLPEEAPAPHEFRIADDSAADWALQKIATERRELARLEELGKAQIAVVEEKLAAARRRCENNTAFLIGKLGQYFDTVEHRKTKTQESYRLLSGTLILKRGKPKAEHDDEKLAEWLQANGYGQYIKPAPKWGEVKGLLNLGPGSVVTMAETGEVVDGVTVVQLPDTFDVKV